MPSSGWVKLWPPQADSSGCPVTTVQPRWVHPALGSSECLPHSGGTVAASSDGRCRQAGEQVPAAAVMGFGGGGGVGGWRLFPWTDGCLRVPAIS